LKNSKKPWHYQTVIDNPDKHGKNAMDIDKTGLNKKRALLIFTGY